MKSLAQIFKIKKSLEFPHDAFVETWSVVLNYEKRLLVPYIFKKLLKSFFAPIGFHSCLY